MLAVYALPIDQSLSEAGFESLLDLCGAEKAAGLRRFVRREDRLRGLWGGLLTRSLICRDLGLSNRAIELDRSERGKPVLLNRPDYHFNTAHAGDWVVAATDDQPVGVDIEEVRAIDLGIAHSHFSPEEAAALEARPAPDREAFFFSLWVLKESYLKATGEGLSRELSSFSVILSDEGPRVSPRPGEPSRYLREYDVARGYKTGVCALHEGFPTHVHFLNSRQVLAAIRTPQGSAARRLKEDEGWSR